MRRLPIILLTIIRMLRSLQICATTKTQRGTTAAIDSYLPMTTPGRDIAAYDTTIPTRLVTMQQTLRQKTNWRRHEWRTEIRPVEGLYIYTNMDKLPLIVGGSRREADVLGIT